MISQKHRWIKSTLFLAYALVFAFYATAATPSDQGLLIMAHSGTTPDRWNAAVLGCVKKANRPEPTRVFFGMGCTLKERDDLERSVHELENAGAKNIVVVPLIVSSYSEVYRQWRYLLALDAKPGFDPKEMAQMMGPEHAGMNMFEDVKPVHPQAAIHFLAGLDDDAVVSEILTKRAQEISKEPSKEAVIIIAHGPNQNDDNHKWLDNLHRISASVQQNGHFKSVEGATLRDDAPPPVRNQAVQDLRDRVSALGKNGSRVLVVPLLMAPGGIEQKINVALNGLTYIQHQDAPARYRCDGPLDQSARLVLFSARP